MTRAPRPPARAASGRARSGRILSGQTLSGQPSSARTGADRTGATRAGAGPVLRTIVLWCPDWPVTAAMRDADLPPGTPVALAHKGLVFACSPAARQEGVRRGIRIREAQSRCPELVVSPYDEALDIRAFEPVLTALEEVMPGAEMLRPGTCVFRSRGPSRFYGGDEEAALWLLDTLDSLGVADARVGVADGAFTAEHAARSTTRPRLRIIPEGGSADFLAPLPIRLLDRPRLVTLLQRLGIRTLGDFASLEASDVAGRFGQEGAHLHSLSAGRDARPVVSRIPPRDLDRVIEFEPPLDRIDQVAFAFRASADAFVEALTAASLVCTSIRIEIDSDAGETSERTWLHPRSFTAADVIDRIRWQLQGDQSRGAGSPHGSSGLGSPVGYIRVVPESVDAIGNHEQGLWGTAADERIHHGLSRVQSMLGHEGVLTATIGGGRSLADRQDLVAWGDRPVGARDVAEPWHGRLPTPAPGTVFERRRPAEVITGGGDTVTVDERGALSGTPAALSVDRGFRALTAWAGPWPLEERWWAVPVGPGGASTRVDRFQVVDDTGLAWLLVLDGGGWWAEATYD
jgi:protein ImuB